MDNVRISHVEWTTENIAKVHAMPSATYTSINQALEASMLEEFGKVRPYRLARTLRGFKGAYTKIREYEVLEDE